jgi:acyl-CoA thioesterase
VKESGGWQRDSPFLTTLGLRLVEDGEGRARVALPLKPAIANRKGDVHGGAIGSLIDMAMSSAIRSSLTDFRGLSTISMSVNFLAVGGGEVTAEAVVTRLGRSTAFAVAEVRNAEGEVIATGQGAFRIIR